MIFNRIYKFAVFEKRKGKRTLQTGPWKLAPGTLELFEPCKSALGRPKQRRRRRWPFKAGFRRSPSPAARARVGKRERRSRTTSWMSWFAGRESKAAAP